jgi:hypothetical protein
MAKWLLIIICPIHLKEVQLIVDAISQEDAITKTIGKTYHCPWHPVHDFIIEENHIVATVKYPYTKYPKVTVAPGKKEEVPEWLKGAWREREDEMLPPDAEPSGSPTLALIKPDAFTSFIYKQAIKSKEDPTFTDTLYFRFDIFTKFLEEARRIAKTDITRAIEYLVNHAPGINMRTLADALGIGYWTAWRKVAELARPDEVRLKEIMKLLDETAPLEKWTETQKEEIILQLRTPKTPKISYGPTWRGTITLWPIKWKKEEELLEELKRILTLEGYPTLTKEEEEEIRKRLHQYWQQKARERLTYWIK